MRDDARELPAARTDGLSRFLGGTPYAVAVRLILLSVLVGVVLHAMGFDAWDIVASVRNMVSRVWNLGFETITSIWRFFLLGAVIVVPIFLLTRFMNSKR